MTTSLSALLKRKSWLIIPFFAILVVTLRSSSFYQSVIDWDESLYLLMADKWLNGYPPYTEIWDNKPPGIYLLFALALTIFGHSVTSIRILACIFVTLTGYILYLIGNLSERNGTSIGLLAAFFYALVSLNNKGLAANTELFFTTFVVLGFYVFFKKVLYLKSVRSQDYIALLVIGLIFGIGFEIKYVVLFDFIALGLIIGIRFISKFRFKEQLPTLMKAYSTISHIYSPP